MAQPKFEFRLGGTLHIIDLGLTDEDWEETGVTIIYGRLTGPMIGVMNGYMHFEAYAVRKRDDDNGYEAVDPEFQENVDALYTLYNYALIPVTIRGREYLTCMFPHGD